MSARKTAPLVLALALALACTAALAQHAERSWYVGLSAGQSKVKFDTGFPAASGGTASSQTKRERGSPYKIYVGHQFNPYFALEGGWTELGNWNSTQNVTAPAAGTLRADVKSGAAHLDALGIIPAGNFAAFFKGGVLHSKTRTGLSPTGAVAVVGDPQRTKSTVNWKLGVGMSYAFSQHWAARVEFEQINKVGEASSTGQFNVRVWTAGATYRF